MGVGSFGGGFNAGIAGASIGAAHSSTIRAASSKGGGWDDKPKTDKGWALFVGLLLASCGVVFGFALLYKPHTETYCGTVVDRFKTDAGYKRAAEAHVVIFNKGLNRNIDVRVTWNAYANSPVGGYMCFDLTNEQVK